MTKNDGSDPFQRLDVVLPHRVTGIVEDRAHRERRSPDTAARRRPRRRTAGSLGPVRDVADMDVVAEVLGVGGRRVEVPARQRRPGESAGRHESRGQPAAAGEQVHEPCFSRHGGSLRELVDTSGAGSPLRPGPRRPGRRRPRPSSCSQIRITVQPAPRQAPHRCPGRVGRSRELLGPPGGIGSGDVACSGHACQKHRRRTRRPVRG